MYEHFEVILRSITAFGLLLIGTRILGKQTISQMTIFDFVATISLGTIAANLSFNTSFAGDPTIVIENGQILEKNMNKMRYTLDYLNQQLREKDIFNIDEVLFAIIETNGTLTVLRKPQFRNVTRQDLMIPVTPENKLPIELIMDGEVIKENLEQNHLTESWLQIELNKRNLDQKDVLYAVLSGNGNMYVNPYENHIHSPIDKE
ncbi:DUF421 domain-containing protein [Rummeliibacillus pycnus]|uniref:DUF421 domain-containing protein n=1 Tax=Rummeliibacillus pycnus TaxID=101070 RepID=UPI000C9C076B|nr:DUF421 domain-containing protein [Rummeliibacillus pycnus]